VSISILDHQLITERYFFPRQENVENPFWINCEDAELSCLYHHKHPESKTVVYFHGNGETVSDYIELFVPLFEQMGYNLFLAEFRGYSMSTGVPTLYSMLSDVDRIIKQIGVPPEKLVLYGRSIGSLYATHGVYLYPDIAGLILESGIALLLERLIMRVQPNEIGISMEEMEKAVDKEFNHREKLAAYKGATLVMHAKNDSLVHYKHGEALYNWAPEPKTLKLFDKGDHNDIFFVNAETYFPLMFKFIAGL
jgi:pimeloyl-ACP methyl ester carboxylesterase